MKKTKVEMNNPLYLGMSILDISKTLMYKFWYDYLKPKCNDKAKLFYMDTDSFVLNMFTEDFFEDINNDVERCLIQSNYDKNDKRPHQIGVNKKVIGRFKDELGGEIMKDFCELRAKAYTYLMEDDSKMKKATEVKRCVIKIRLMFENYKDSLLNNKTIMLSQLRFKSDHHNVYTEEVYKFALNSNNNKRLQTFDRITTYTYGTNAFKLLKYVKVKCLLKYVAMYN